MSESQRRHLPIDRREVIVESLAAGDVGDGERLGNLRQDEPPEPAIDLCEAIAFEQRRRIRLVNGVLEQQRQHVLDVVDVLDVVAVGELLQHRDLVAQFGEPALQAGELQRVDLGARHVLPFVQRMIGQPCGITQQQIRARIQRHIHRQTPPGATLREPRG